MTPTAAIPAAAQRLVRSASGRRVLCTALFLGGLLALALLSAGKSQAAEPVPDPLKAVHEAASAKSAPDPVTSAQDQVTAAQEPLKSPQKPVKSALKPVESALKSTPQTKPAPPPPPAKSAAKQPQRPVEQSAPAAATTVRKHIEPTRTALRTTAQTGARTTDRTVKAVAHTAQAATRDLLARPLSRLAQSMTTAAESLPEPKLLPFPLPEPGGQAPPERTAPPPLPDRTQNDGTRADNKQDRARPDSAGQLPTCSTATPVAIGDHTPAAAHHTPADQPTPQPSTPHQPYGNAVQSATDAGQQQRSGDQYAATTPADGSPFWLLPGAGPLAERFPLRDRHRDILEFPG